MTEVIEASGDNSVHIIDCDHAGRLFWRYVSHWCEHGGSHFGFFSCGADDTVPKGRDLPFDLFTACMTTPGKTALLWHSRHYFFYKEGPLQPLKPEKCEQLPSGIIQEVTLILHRLAEAIACDVLDQDLQLRFFQTDPTVAHFAAHFFLAVKIFSFFKIQPICYPSMQTFIPKIKNHPFWNTFDFQLDSALVQVSSPSPLPSLGYTSFLEQSIRTLKHVTKVSTAVISFPGQLTTLPTVLTNSELQESGCEVLSVYIDKSVDAIRQVMLFPIVVPLFQLFRRGIGGDFMFLSIAKILCFMPQTRRLLFGWSPNLFEESIFPLLLVDKPLLPLIIATLLVRDNPSAAESVSGKWSEAILPLLRNRYSDVRLWSLLFLTTILPHVSDRDVAIDSIIDRLADDHSEVRATALNTLHCLLIIHV
jgi:regulator-associated protein of mTOR